MNKVIKEKEEKTNLITFLKNNKEILLFSAYFIWLFVQILMLLYVLWFAWLSYLSISFSLVLFVIFSFLFLISIPLFFIFIIFSLIFSIIYLWLIWWISLFVCIIILVIFKKYNKAKNFINKIKPKIDKFYFIYTWITFLMLFWILLYFTFWFKVVTLKLDNNEKVFWKFLFYNQDYYFIEICWERIVYPSSEVKSTIIETESYKVRTMKKEQIDWLNKKYNDFCNNYKK